KTGLETPSAIVSGLNPMAVPLAVDKAGRLNSALLPVIPSVSVAIQFDGIDDPFVLDFPLTGEVYLNRRRDGRRLLHTGTASQETHHSQKTRNEGDFFQIHSGRLRVDVESFGI